ncbi:MAG: helix-turn-helix transcriptional regulator [Candidatus Heimdallarchaeota archaeon]|nr:MAG: helix-turn-helix transcriptional regulator [Candidatus Heimdallarchaeota archaeon]
MEVKPGILQECLPAEVDGICLKPLTRYLKLISKKWMVFVIMVFPKRHDDSSLEGKYSKYSTPLRYSEIKKRIQGITSQKISDTTLSQRLNELGELRIIEREQFEQIPPRVEYTLSLKGFELQESLQPLIEWAIKACHKED